MQCGNANSVALGLHETPYVVVVVGVGGLFRYNNRIPGYIT
jgi:hypothetical protein